MLASNSLPLFTPKQQYAIMAIGFMTVLIVGTGGCIALVLGALWLVGQIVLLTLQSLAVCMAAIGTAYTASGPVAQLLFISFILFLLYRACKHVRRVS